MNRNAYLGLGSNLGDRLFNLREALKRLVSSGECQIEACSSVYETEPVGFMDQANFLNAVVRITTSLDPLALLSCCRSVEESMGRVRTIKWGPRVIDIDILIFDHEIVCTGELIVPHPEMLNRGFVMIPLAEIAPDLEVASGVTAREVAERIGSAGVRYFGRLL